MSAKYSQRPTIIIYAIAIVLTLLFVLITNPEHQLVLGAILTIQGIFSATYIGFLKSKLIFTHKNYEEVDEKYWENERAKISDEGVLRRVDYLGDHLRLKKPETITEDELRKYRENVLWQLENTILTAITTPTEEDPDKKEEEIIH